MSRNTTCPPCQDGDHKRHYRVVEAAPEGGVGGAVCTCEGECKDRTPEDRLRDLGIDLAWFDGHPASGGRDGE